MTKKHALQYFICGHNFKSHNFQTESPFKHAASTCRGSTTLSFSSPCYALCLGHFEFKTLLTLSSAFSERAKFFCTRPLNWSYVRNWHKQVFFGTKKFGKTLHIPSFSETRSPWTVCTFCVILEQGKCVEIFLFVLMRSTK